MSSFDVVIVGGGVIGLSTAFSVAAEGARVAVVERGQPGMEASWAGAGIVPPGNFERAATPYDQLRALSSEMFSKFSDMLRDLTGIDNGYRACGGIEYLADSESEETLAAWQREEIDFELIQPQGPYSHAAGYLLPDLAQVRNPWHLKALESACRLAQIEIRSEVEVDHLVHAGSRVAGVALGNGERVEAKWVVVAAGAWSDRLLAPFGIATGIAPVRGQIALLKFDEPPFKRVLLEGKRYIVPRDDGHVLIGSTEEPEAGFVKQTTLEAIDELLDFAVTLAPALATGKLVKTWAGLRPGSADGLPSIGPVGGVENLLLASGHFRAGIQLSQATGIMIADLIAGRAPIIPIEAFRPGRAPGIRARPLFRS
jgi:glycine oxidase